VAAESNFDVSNLELWRGNPSDIRKLTGWKELSDARAIHYLRTFGATRTGAEINHWISNTTKETWDDPNAAVGSAFRSGQR
jgi:hypothetical protein